MEKEDIVWEVPVHRSLTKPVYWMGIPRGLFIIELVLGAFGGLIFKTFLIIFFLVFLHMVFKYLGDKDPLFHEVFMRSLRHDLFYRN